MLTDEQRSAVAAYFSVYKGKEKGGTKLAVPPHGVCHPSIERAVACIKDAWSEVRLPSFPSRYQPSNSQVMHLTPSYTSQRCLGAIACLMLCNSACVAHLKSEMTGTWYSVTGFVLHIFPTKSISFVVNTTGTIA